MKNYYSFAYLDKKMIDILYTQIFDNIVEKIISLTNTEQIDSELQASLFKFINSSIEGQESSITSNNVKIIDSIYKKAQILINHFKDENNININDIIDNNCMKNESIYFVGKATFFLSDIYDKTSGLSLFSSPYIEDRYITIDNNSVFVLETGNTDFMHKHCSSYIYTDDYYGINFMNNLDYGILMHLSNDKTEKSIRHLTTKIKRAKHFRFYVFGEFIKESNEYYKISPFAVWQ